VEPGASIPGGSSGDSGASSDPFLVGSDDGGPPGMPGSCGRSPSDLSLSSDDVELPGPGGVVAPDLGEFVMTPPPHRCRVSELGQFPAPRLVPNLRRAGSAATDPREGHRCKDPRMSARMKR
jgi:hypothetical protein